ncbi:MAG: HAMP domain-containing sensor histidine kinase [Kofleriaceae bacterium]|nr:HAMP domain-containing sensor histidine kinase [Kofleriaceae bacterium]
MNPPRPPRTTARRIAGAFGLVLVLFALALVVMIVSLRNIGAAEEEVARLDRAKHAGHHAAAMAREQYMHQAHTMLAWDNSHMDHYAETAQAARHATEHLGHEIAGRPGAEEQAKEIARLIIESDRLFREEVWPAIQRNDRSRMAELHHMTERPVEEVVTLNEKLNRSLEADSEAAQKRAEDIRSNARFAVLVCFALAIAAAAAVGYYLMRSISRPVAALRAGAVRVGAGDLDARIALPGSDELSELARVFDQMTADLKRHQDDLLEAHRLASIGQVASGVAHEINNPLGVILGYVTLLRRDPQLTDREDLRIIEDEVRQSLAIVAGLLDLARPVKLDTTVIDLRVVARETASRLDEVGRSEGVEIRFRDASVPKVMADEGKVRQIALNLLSNAVEAARDPAAEAAVVDVTWCERERLAWLQIDDHGPGIAPEAKDRVFEPFFTTRSKGHGLGLAIARTLARAHGGDIHLEPRPGGRGTRASLSLPIEPPSNRAAA